MSEQTGYLAAPGFEPQLARALGQVGEVSAVHGRLFVVPGPARPMPWALNTWHELRTLPITSIGDAVRCLRGLQRNWAHLPSTLHRRASLIAEQLPHVSARPLEFPAPRPSAPLGSWMLLDKHTLLAAPRCSSAFAHGEVQFVEDRESAPSRAYLKLWEALTLLDERPGPGDLCVDLGSSPGGWSWVLQQLGASVISVDKAPLDPQIAGLASITHRQESAFGIPPESLGPVAWMVCDIACYPERLLDLVQRWLASGTCQRFVCTVKLQGEADDPALEALAALPESRLVHLFHNKHELTWLRVPGAL